MVALSTLSSDIFNWCVLSVTNSKHALLACILELFLGPIAAICFRRMKNVLDNRTYVLLLCGPWKRNAP
jgi:hypothetical protein